MLNLSQGRAGFVAAEPRQGSLSAAACGEGEARPREGDKDEDCSGQPKALGQVMALPLGGPELPAGTYLCLGGP